MCNYSNLLLTIIERHHNHNKWDSGVFKGIKTISNTKVGTVGQDFIEQLCLHLNIDHSFPLNSSGARATQSPWDIKINNITFELKTATEDTNGKFQFNHIRYHRSYDALMCLGISPERIFFKMWTKAQVTTGRAGRLVSMESGANASYKLTKSPNDLIIIDDFHNQLNQFVILYNQQL
jgi:hypothetical protein